MCRLYGARAIRRPRLVEKTLDLDKVKSAKHGWRFESVDRGAREKHNGAVIFVCAFEPRREIYVIADHGISHALYRTDGAGQDFAGRYPDTDLDRFKAVLDASAIQS